MTSKRFNYQPDKQYPLSHVSVLTPSVSYMNSEQPYDWSKEENPSEATLYDWAKEAEPKVIETPHVDEEFVSVDALVIDAASRFAKRASTG